MSERVGSALQNYSVALFDVYQQECGDSISYWDAESGFEKYLSSRRFNYGPYNDVKNLAATPGDAAQVFREYLRDGGNCPDTSLRKQAGQIADNFHVSVRRTVAYIDGDISYTSDPQKLYENWQRYLNLYLESIEQLKIAADRFSGEDNLDYLLLGELRARTNRVKIIAQEMDLRMKELKKAEFQTSLEGTTVFYHDQRLSNFHTIPLIISNAVKPDSGFLGLVNDAIEFLQIGHSDLHDPFDWVNTVTLEVVKEAKAQVVVEITGRGTALRAVNTPAVFELIDRVAISVIRQALQNGSARLAFRWDAFKKQFVILLPALAEGEMARIDQLLAVLKGSRSGGSQVEIRVPMKALPKAVPQANQPPSGGKGISNDEEITSLESEGEDEMEDEMEELALDEELTLDEGFEVYAMPDVSLPFAETALPFPL